MPQRSLSGALVAKSYLVEQHLSFDGVIERYEAVHTRTGAGFELWFEHDQREPSFAFEAQIAAGRIDDPSSRAARPLGSHDGMRVIALPPLIGERALDATRHGPLPPDRAARYACRLLGLLDRAHQARVAHLGLDPSNVYLGETSAGPSVLLESYASARFEGGPSPRPERHVGAVLMPPVGALRYLAPEQVVDKVERPALVDVYRVGALIFSMATGQAPVDGDSAPSVLYRILRGEVSRAASTIAPSAAPLDAVIARAMALDPGDRYPSAAAMERDLSAAVRPSSTR